MRHLVQQPLFSFLIWWAFLATDSSSFTLSKPTRRRDSVVRCNSLSKLIVGGAAAFGISQACRIIQQGDVAILERLGKYHARLDPGFHLIVPFVDQIRHRITEREQVFDIPPQKCITSDNAPLLADAVVYWRIIDPIKATYSVVDLELAIQNLVLTELRSEIGKLTLDMTFSARGKINAVILDDLDTATEPWGVKITRVEVRDIVPNREIMKAMEMQMAAERTKRAVVIKSQGERERAINKAEGLAQSRLIEAKASAEAVRVEASAEASKLELEAAGVGRALAAIADSMHNNTNKSTNDAAARFQLMREYLSAQRALATSPNSKVIVTSDKANDVFGKAMAFYDTAGASATTSSS